jgi:hypothetical protein
MIARLLHSSRIERLDATANLPALRGQEGPRAATCRGEERVGGVKEDVKFKYRPRIRRSARRPVPHGRYAASIIDRINSPQARSTTLRLVPRRVVTARLLGPRMP